MDFVFDRTADARVAKRLTNVVDAAHESAGIEVERAISGIGVTRVLDRPAIIRGLPKTIRTGNGKEFCGKATIARAHEGGVQLRLIEPGKPNQNADVVPFNGRLRDECLDEHGFPSLLHARTEIERWRLEYDEGRPKQAQGGLTPAAYAKQSSNSGLQTDPLLKAGDIDASLSKGPDAGHFPWACEKREVARICGASPRGAPVFDSSQMRGRGAGSAWIQHFATCPKGNR
ncbi:MAG: hypothetical protein BGP10_08260 [Rhodanobacter sp. 68-29]|nr:transposase family protein [Rhodanobacter sp.]ODU75713.1 MAG: hypothetical protein ABT17_03095 [Rhodanobacter sp. SCN 69-32]OJY57000.1 MAG: hypothetical protein BGP10_08260 [Rhodanobacter sp. 68-29]